MTLSGSKLYGTNTENSDTDIKGIFIPDMDEVLLGKDPSNITFTTGNDNEKNSKDDIDFSLVNIRTFFNQLKKSETGAVDIFFSMYSEDTIIFEDKGFTETLKENKDIFLNTNMKSFIGYALGQTKKFQIKGDRYNELDSFVKTFSDTFKENKRMKMSEIWSDLKENISKMKYKYIEIKNAETSNGRQGEYLSILGKLYFNTNTCEYVIERVEKLYNQFGNRTKTISEESFDKKAISHALRISLEVKELLETRFIQFPLKEKELVLKVKNGEVDMEETLNLIQETLSEVDALIETSDIPKHCSEKEVNELLLKILKGRE